MDIEAVIWFYEVATAGSFVGAARRLGQPSSNVSRRIANLEASLGVKLLLRTTRSLSLTHDGEALLPMASSLAASKMQVAEWKESIGDEPNGLLRVTAPHSFARQPLTQWLIQYRSLYPKVRTELIHSNDYLDFQENRLDFAFRQGPLADSTLIAKRLFSIEYGVFAAPQIVEKFCHIDTPQDLDEVPVISAGSIGKCFPWRFKEKHWAPQAPALSFEDISQCLEAAVAGQGFTHASRYEAAPYIQAGQLVEVLHTFRPSPVGFYMVYPSREHRSLKSETFLDFVQEEVLKFGAADGLSVSQ